MLRTFKINTAIVICFAFIFRLLFVNLSFVSSPDLHQKRHPVKGHISNVMKRRGLPSNGSGKKETQMIEICCEEVSDDDDQFKTNPQSFMQVLYFLFESTFNNGLRIFSNFSKDYALSHRYIIYQVFRI